MATSKKKKSENTDDEKVIDLAAEKLLEKILSRDYYSEDLVKRLAEAATSKFTPKLHEKIAEKIDEVVTSRFEGLLFKTNSWGERTGEQIGMTDLILNKVEKWLEEKVDPKTGRREDYSSSIRRYEYLTKTLPCQDLEKRINEKINAIRETALSEVTNTISEILTKKIAAKGGV